MATFVLEQVALGSPVDDSVGRGWRPKEMVIMEQAPLTALVVFESFFGNTRTIAHAVAEGLRLEGVTPTVQEVSAAVPADVTGYHLLVVGGPTHAFGLSRESTRAEAERRGASVHLPGPGLRDWLECLPSPEYALAAAFDTRAEKVRHLPMSAAHAAGKMLRRRGYVLAVKPAGFVVQDVEGPLAHGETERAIAWGRTLADEVRLYRAAKALDHHRPRARVRTH
jgi:hypothetical protein